MSGTNDIKLFVDSKFHFWLLACFKKWIFATSTYLCKCNDALDGNTNFVNILATFVAM